MPFVSIVGYVQIRAPTVPGKYVWLAGWRRVNATLSTRWPAAFFHAAALSPSAERTLLAFFATFASSSYCVRWRRCERKLTASSSYIGSIFYGITMLSTSYGRSKAGKAGDRRWTHFLPSLTETAHNGPWLTMSEAFWRNAWTQSVLFQLLHFKFTDH